MTNYSDLSSDEVLAKIENTLGAWAGPENIGLENQDPLASLATAIALVFMEMGRMIFPPGKNDPIGCLVAGCIQSAFNIGVAHGRYLQGQEEEK